MKQFDIAICGYGPVGSTFAGLMGKLGHKVLVIDRTLVPPLRLELSIQMENNLEHLIGWVLQKK